ncbi:MAG: EAL domain-containing protein [Methylotenera sp.]|uniref:EAL domain-containing protein n=1 Tax=Methylotenera sp. TaxID=2051956 RepID=UPI0024873653|nr:EAL domain-containing protein [Methylotenera sp.]MDI1308840.1 EAL domain-containing protein [Methylotenera sp.]
MLKPYFEKRVIKEKLLLMNFLVVGFAMLFLFVLTVAYQYATYKNELISNLNSQISVIESNLGSAIAFEDIVTANEIFQTLRLDKSVDKAYVQLENNKIFAEYQRDNKSGEINVPLSKSAIKNGDVHITRDIIVNGMSLGSLHLDANLNQVRYRINIFSFFLMIAMSVAVLLAKYVSNRLSRFITEPIIYLEQLVTKVTKNHDYFQRSTIHSIDEIGALSIGINNMLDGIQQRDNKLLDELDRRAKVEQKLDRLAYTDSQTELSNRHAFTASINRLTGFGDDGIEHFYLLLLDLDNFKVVNDSFGHDIGDQLLRQCGQRLHWMLNEEDFVFRIGGDEFAIVLKDVKSIDDVEKVCGRITETISQKFMVNGHEIFVGVSIGISQYQNRNFSETNLIKNADIAMYWAKSAGKNTFKFYSDEIETANCFFQKITTDLHNALKDNEFELLYQPIINVKTGHMVGVEALLRWHHQDEGTISPDIFIPIAEKNGLIAPIGEWVIREALKQLKTWERLNGPQLFVNVNVSARQLFDKRIIDVIGDAILEFEVDPKCINVELTESSLMEDVNRAIVILRELKKLGVGIAVDDFGTGHSSMSYLKQFPVDTIKIDKCFVRGIPQDDVDVAIVEAIFALAKSLKLDVVAEGVETEAQYDFLKHKNCAKVQGYLFNRPLPVIEIDRLLMQSNEIKRLIEMEMYEDDG